MKTCRSKKSVLALAFLLMGCYGAMAQIKPSVYVGWGNYTNLGGTVGIGTEIRYKFISANAAIGHDYCNGAFKTGSYKDMEPVGDNPFWGFDVGLKCYFIKGFFGGVNYSLLGKRCLKETQERVKVDNFYGFSFTLGYKWDFYKGLYGMTYLGTTSSKEANHWFLGGAAPRLGLILGYNFNH